MIYLLSILIFAYFDAVIDYKKIKKEINVHTWLQYVVRALIFLWLYFFFGSSWIDLIASMMVYWFVFDSLMGWKLKRNVIYLGSGFLDRLQKLVWLWPVWVFKGILAIAAGGYIIKPELFQV
jgi:hypothetical protein